VVEEKAAAEEAERKRVAEEKAAAEEAERKKVAEKAEKESWEEMLKSVDETARSFNIDPEKMVQSLEPLFRQMGGFESINDALAQATGQRAEESVAGQATHERVVEKFNRESDKWVPSPELDREILADKMRVKEEEIEKKKNEEEAERQEQLKKIEAETAANIEAEPVTIDHSGRVREIKITEIGYTSPGDLVDRFKKVTSQLGFNRKKNMGGRSFGAWYGDYDFSRAMKPSYRAALTDLSLSIMDAHDIGYVFLKPEEKDKPSEKLLSILDEGNKKTTKKVKGRESRSTVDRETLEKGGFSPKKTPELFVKMHKYYLLDIAAVQKLLKPYLRKKISNKKTVKEKEDLEPTGIKKKTVTGKPVKKKAVPPNKGLVSNMQPMTFKEIQATHTVPGNRFPTYVHSDGEIRDKIRFLSAEEANLSQDQKDFLARLREAQFLRKQRR
jgi:hypothetical protein